MCTLPRDFLFLVLHLIQLFGVPLKLEDSIKGLQGGGSLYATICCWFFSGEI